MPKCQSIIVRATPEPSCPTTERPEQCNTTETQEICE